MQIKRALFLFILMVAFVFGQSVDIKILKEGSGDAVKKGQLVRVHYTGTLSDGTKFDSSRDREEPLEFMLGVGQVIQGWDIGIVGMKSGEIRKLKIPSALAYGNRAIGPIPANSDLTFEVELLGAEQSIDPDSLLSPSVLRWKTLIPGLEIFDEVVGNGQETHAGMEIVFHYTGWLTNGHKFGSSKDVGKPAEAVIGTNKLVKGLELGLDKVKQGSVRWLRISPALGYGPAAMANIPPHSTLIFRVELQKVEFDESLAANMDFFPQVDSSWQKGKDGLRYLIERKGSGDGAKAGDFIKVHYTGWLLDGTKFDSSRDRGEPLSLELGAGRVIKGWDLGLEGMKHGEKRYLLIPPAIGYGSRGGGPIPPNATLIFAVEMM